MNRARPRAIVFSIRVIWHIYSSIKDEPAENVSICRNLTGGSDHCCREKSDTTSLTRGRCRCVLMSLIDDKSQIMRTNRLLRPSGPAAALLVSLYAAAASAQYPS